MNSLFFFRLRFQALIKSDSSHSIFHLLISDKKLDGKNRVGYGLSDRNDYVFLLRFVIIAAIQETAHDALNFSDKISCLNSQGLGLFSSGVWTR